MQLNIEKNPITGGYYCFFSYNDQYFYADVSLVNRSHPDYYGECMIFKADENHQVTSWKELYIVP